jgi:hypothetical protein
MGAHPNPHLPVVRNYMAPQEAPTEKNKYKITELSVSESNGVAPSYVVDGATHHGGSHKENHAAQ